MRSLAAPVAASIEIKRSQFITSVLPVTSESDARAEITAVRETYPDARHHCSAFVIYRPGENLLERSSDDGEPSGTAGNPMLQVLHGEQLVNVVAIVTRYFGGVKLGTGGLVRAYTQAVQAALATAKFTTFQRLQAGQIHVPAAEAARLVDQLQRFGVTTEVTWAEPCVLSFAVPPATCALLEATIAEHSKGRLQVEWTGIHETFA